MNIVDVVLLFFCPFNFCSLDFLFCHLKINKRRVLICFDINALIFDAICNIYFKSGFQIPLICVVSATPVCLHYFFSDEYHELITVLIRMNRICRLCWINVVLTVFNRLPVFSAVVLFCDANADSGIKQSKWRLWLLLILCLCTWLLHNFHCWWQPGFNQILYTVFAQWLKII